MCLIALQFATDRECPMLVAANREESYDRLALPPHLQPAGGPRVMCGIDRLAGGTWLGVNQFRLLVAVTNRPKRVLPLAPRSRGLLCRELLNGGTAREACQRAVRELQSGHYAGCNFLCVDPAEGWIVHAGDRVESISLTPGLHLIANGDLDDLNDARLSRARDALQSPLAASAAEFIPRAVGVCSLTRGPNGEPPIVLRTANRGTVSSSLIALGTRPEHAVYLHASGPPDEVAYQDYSRWLREMLEVR